MRHLFKKIAFPLFLLIIDIVVFLTNYKQGAYLIGWDNVFPEFNFWLNIKRDFFAIWQQYRGLGLIDGMSHASLIIQDFVRIFLSLFMTTDLIRWVYILGLHFVGGLGMMKLLNNILDDKNSTSTEIIAFLGALFYMFNLGSIIQFYLPLEVFIVHFAFLPWLILFTLRYLQKGYKKDLYLLGTLSLLATSQAHVPTVFIAYAMGLSIILFASLISEKFKNWKKILIIVMVIFVTNAFWFIPFAVTNISNSKIVSNSKPFQMASNDIFYRNNKYGDFNDVALIKGLPLEFLHHDYKTNSNQLMMRPWIDHINSPFFYIPAWILFFLVVFGLFHSLKPKNKNLLPFATVFIFSFFMLGTDIPIINILSQFLRKSIPLFNIIFRFTFTKFSIIYAFSYSILLAVGLNIFLNKIRVLHNYKRYVIEIIFFLLIIFYSFPSFQGNFFYENLKIKIPNEYFQVFEFFKNQKKDERIAELPIPWYWSWLQPKWGTINSGFIWHGIEQPLMDLAFMPWGAQNENYYWELDQAIFSNNASLLEKVLDKYDISWIYLDKNILNEPGRRMTYEKYEQLLNNTNGVQLSTQFGSINIYRHQLKNNLNNFVEIKKNLPVIGSKYQYDNYDQAYLDYGDYYTTNNSQVYYPFRSLFSGKDPKDIEYTVNEDGQFLYFKSQLPANVKDWILQDSSSLKDEFTVFDKNLNIKKYSPKISVVDNILTVKIDKKLALLYQSSTDQNYLNLTNDACQKNEKGTALMKKIKNEGYRFTSVSSNSCIKIELSYLSQRYGYLFNIQTTTDNKRGLHINLTNDTTDRSDMETYTDNDEQFHNYYLISSPRGFYDLGYSLYINNISEGREKVINTLEKINIYQIPYYFLKDLKMVKNLNQINTNDKKTVFTNVSQKNISYYEVKMNQIDNGSILYLSQSYNSGWIAFADGKILPHVLVNNWANGWKLDGQTNNVTIIFWPQYLEFLGFALLAIAFLSILLIKKRYD
jgi:hypothetical protein